MTCHAKLAPALQPLHYWRTLREEADSDGSGTNWFAAWPEPERDIEMVAANDNEAPPPEIEMELYEDSAEALLRRFHDVETRTGPDGRVLIVGGDVEFSPTTGRLVRAGSLIFADFTNRRPFAKSPMAGEMLGTQTGSGKVIPLDLKSRYRPRKTLPPPPLPAPVTGQAGFEARDELAALLSILDDRTVRVLDEALRAHNLEQLGKMLGFGGEYARKAGKMALLKAVAALEAARSDISKKVAA